MISSSFQIHVLLTYLKISLKFVIKFLESAQKLTVNLDEKYNAL